MYYKCAVFSQLDLALQVPKGPQKQFNFQLGINNLKPNPVRPIQKILPFGIHTRLPVPPNESIKSRFEPNPCKSVFSA